MTLRQLGRGSQLPTVLPRSQFQDFLCVEWSTKRDEPLFQVRDYVHCARAFALNTWGGIERGWLRSAHSTGLVRELQ